MAKNDSTMVELTVDSKLKYITKSLLQEKRTNYLLGIFFEDVEGLKALPPILNYPGAKTQAPERETLQPLK